jgi:hypothetical protein
MANGTRASATTRLSHPAAKPQKVSSRIRADVRHAGDSGTCPSIGSELGFDGTPGEDGQQSVAVTPATSMTRHARRPQGVLLDEVDGARRISGRHLFFVPEVAGVSSDGPGLAREHHLQRKESSATPEPGTSDCRHCWRLGVTVRCSSKMKRTLSQPQRGFTPVGATQRVANL